MSFSLLALGFLAGPASAGTPSSAPEAVPPALRPALFQALAKDAGPAYSIKKDGCATLPKSKLKACFGAGGVRFAGAQQLALHLAAFGRGTKLAQVTAVQPVIKGNQLSYRHGNLTEWWRVLPMGFEQGFTIAKRPAGHGNLTLALAMTRLSRAGGNPVTTSSSIPLRSEGGNELAWGKLRYGQLVVTDATGKVVPATLKSSGDRILIAVNDAHAAYPLTVDPLVWIEQKVTASDGIATAFGDSVAVEGTTALIGASATPVNGNLQQGSAYVFKESNGVWTETQALTASDGGEYGNFGSAVALDGTTALIGAAGTTIDGKIYVGSAYVFTESNGTWTQTAELIGDDVAGSHFGVSVALDGTTALVGEQIDPSNENLDGATFVFTESGGTWTQTAKLVPNVRGSQDCFGCSVALDGTTALIGADYYPVYDPSAAYVFNESNGVWSQTQKLTATGADVGGFGSGVAIEGTTALIGALATDVNGNSGQGAAFVFKESNGVWSQTQELTASDGTSGADFGKSVALDGTTALVGAPVLGDGDGNLAYIFKEVNGSWVQVQELAPSDAGAGGYLEFGFSVALDGATALIGARLAAISSGLGAAYFYGGSNLALNESAPEAVAQGQHYVSQTIATNSSSAASPAVTATMAVPAAASFVSATATQGSCSEDAGVVTCDFGQINGNAGTATANVTLKATGNVGDTIENTASIAKATPSLTTSAATTISEGGACPGGYSEYGGDLNAGKRTHSPVYQAPAGVENAILTGPSGFQLYAVFQNAQGRKTFRIPGNEVHRQAPAGTFTWVVKAGNTGGAYTLCVLHP